MPYRLPVNSRRFHGDMRAVFGRQPFRQCHEILGRRLERADLSLSRAIHHMAHAGHHCILVNIKTGTMPMQNFHRFSLNAAGLEPPLSKSRTRAPGLSPARDTIWGAQGFRVRLTDGLARTKINTDLCVDGTTAAYPRLPPVSYPAGRGLRWGANENHHPTLRPAVLSAGLFVACPAVTDPPRPPVSRCGARQWRGRRHC